MLSILVVVAAIVGVVALVAAVGLAASPTSRIPWESYTVGFVPAVPTLSPTPPVRRLSDEQLRREWHDTATRLRHAGPTLELVELRQRLLDEHDRRHPGREVGAGVDWDDLLRS